MEEKEVSIFTEDYRAVEHVFEQLDLQIVSEEKTEDGLYTTYKVKPKE